jgi:DNA-binding transcriptional MerR regulator
MDSTRDVALPPPSSPLTSGDVSRALNLSRSRILQLEVEGRLVPYDRTAGGLRLYRPADVERERRRRAGA